MQASRAFRCAFTHMQPNLSPSGDVHRALQLFLSLRPSEQAPRGCVPSFNEQNEKGGGGEHPLFVQCVSQQTCAIQAKNQGLNIACFSPQTHLKMPIKSTPVHTATAQPPIPALIHSLRLSADALIQSQFRPHVLSITTSTQHKNNLDDAMRH